MTEVSLDSLNTMDKAAFVAALSDIYEHSPWVAEAVMARRPFRSLVSLHDAMIDAVRNAGRERITELIKAHPDLAGKLARSGALTAHSTAEQSSVGLDRLSEEEFTAFHRLNDSYRAKFGFPFIVCVRRHSKDSILQQFEQRLKNEMAAEQNAALGEIFRIAALRLDQRIGAPEKLKVSGRLSTHVLDTHGGKPAAGVAVELFEVSKSGNAAPIGRATTNADGRTDKPLIGDRPVPIGRYEIRFWIGDYFARSGAANAEQPFLDIVPVRFGVAEPEGHYHVPLLVTPWSYATYRGS